MWSRYVESGDMSSFETLFKKYYLQLTRFSWRFVKSKAIAEGIVQDFFTDLWENGEELNINGTIRSYFFRAVRNRSLNQIKHQKVKNKYDRLWMEQNVNPITVLRDEKREEQVKKAVEKAIESLPERGKMIFKLHKFDGLTYKEIAEVMDISVKTVESQMPRSLKMLREKLAYLCHLSLRS
ncbi:MAG: RNA polymerase sigma-70 factor [Cyclobacteriaceae bacterium]